MNNHPTRQWIIEKSTPLFNQKGLFGVSISDIMDVTGLKKGGIYHYFAGKESIAIESFDYAVLQVEHWFDNRLRDKTTAVEKLIALVDAFDDYAASPPVPGGCPVMNTSVECDDAHPILLKRAQQAMDRLRRRLSALVTQGINEGDIQKEVHPDRVVTVLISCFEGALMMCRLYGHTQYMLQMTTHLKEYLHSITSSKE